MKHAFLASVVASSIALMSATSAHAIPTQQTDATPVAVAAGSGAVFVTGALSGASTQQINFQSLIPANALDISFSWNAGITLSGWNLYSSSGPASWTLGSLVPVTFGTLGKSASASMIAAPYGYYSLVIDVASATGAGQKINGNIDANDVPAPAALGLLGIGLLGMGLTRRRNGSTTTASV